MSQNNFEQSNNENKGANNSESSSVNKTFASIEEELEYLRGEVKKNQDKTVPSQTTAPSKVFVYPLCSGNQAMRLDIEFA